VQEGDAGAELEATGHDAPAARLAESHADKRAASCGATGTDGEADQDSAHRAIVAGLPVR
jgi:hypothetical protein